MSLVLMFPGQGSQSPGMGRALVENFVEARRVFQEVDDALAQKLSQLAFEGPESELTLTRNAQPALMAVSLAALKVLQQECGLNITQQCRYVAGHSLGEYSALAALGVISLADAARLLRLRGEAMQRAVEPGVGAMAALLGVDAANAQTICAAAANESGRICEIANDNGGGQIVISGAKVAIERAIELAKDTGVKRVVLLPVSAPFHCQLMAPAADEMANALQQIKLDDLPIPLIANVTALPVSQASCLPELLVKQMTGTVQWRRSMIYAHQQNVNYFAEIGPGKVLSGLCKRICLQAQTISFGSPDDLKGFSTLLQDSKSPND